ncbi:hypothetical protein SARC_01742 [Sphaeroforma arctica JP610]|uniref:Uncharacterized protein n=1 Tax=Sphaeroforma arctica JP610 TaxID=667725 RepID=A0A0L0GAQ4_9EUKA|nr:hypothetical protein SARC_01742 [Sphaeroforma arctica JP610]KNC86082.1 hypothetical protein SARC_01742 [Sphaeroforma arctica JP610]|eukprot:XP_014159984.1 hypothetical protein SARC_01742 [Sphaeroforma arctica JP610]
MSGAEEISAVTIQPDPYWPCPVSTHRHKRGQCDECKRCFGCETPCGNDIEYACKGSTCCCHTTNYKGQKNNKRKRVQYAAQQVEARRSRREKEPVDDAEVDVVAKSEREVIEDQLADQRDPVQPYMYQISHLALQTETAKRDAMVGHVHGLTRRMIDIISCRDKRASNLLYKLIINQAENELENLRQICRCSCAH